MNNSRDKNIKVAAETLSIVEDGSYIVDPDIDVFFEEEVFFAMKNTTYYPGNVKVANTKINSLKPKFEVVNETTAQAAQRWLDTGIVDPVALNFANGTTPGGGFLSGAQAQEEDLCRCSALYHCLIMQPNFYTNNKNSRSHLYTNGMIYSPAVPFFRDFYLNKLRDPFLLSIITSPAPMARIMAENEKKLLPLTIHRRAIKILEVARDNGHKNIILGAWGCGAFGNDPREVANAFLNALEIVPTFKNVCFAIYDTTLEQKLYKTFKEIIL